MKLTVRNLSQIRAGSATPEMFAEAFDDLLGYIGTMADQTVSNPAGTVQPPSPPLALNTVAAGGYADHQIQDSDPVARGIIYHIESSPTQTFTSPKLVYSGPSRNFSHFMGATTLRFRAFKQYPTSAPSAPVYFGGASNPTAVSGGGAITGPVPQPSAGSGTGPTSGNSSRPEGYGFAPTRGTPATSNLSINPRLNPLNPFQT